MDTKLYFIIYIVIINIISFFIMKLDKLKAKKNKHRISEQSLFTYSLLLGATGIYAGMYKYRHKTKQFKFVVLIPILIFINILTIYYIFTMLL